MVLSIATEPLNIDPSQKVALKLAYTKGQDSSATEGKTNYIPNTIEKNNNNSLAFWDTFRLQFFFSLFYSIYLGPMLETPYCGQERIFFPMGQKWGFSHFVFHIKRRCQGPEFRWPFDLYWWAELNFGQEHEFLEHLFLNFSPPLTAA